MFPDENPDQDEEESLIDTEEDELNQPERGNWYIILF